MNYQIGTQAQIQTRAPSHVIGREIEEHSYTGIIVQTPNWLDSNYVSIRTGNPEHPVSHIHRSRIVGFEASKVDSGIRLFRVTSKSKGKSYQVTVRDSKVECDCVGFQFHRYCRHSTAVKVKLGV
jgi:Tfp pilus assembly protein PilX